MYWEGMVLITDHYQFVLIFIVLLNLEIVSRLEITLLGMISQGITSLLMYLVKNIYFPGMFSKFGNRGICISRPEILTCNIQSFTFFFYYYKEGLKPKISSL